MRKGIVLFLIFAFVIGLVLITDEASAIWGKKKDEEAQAEETSKAVCKFESQENMAEFEQLYVAKQATFGRMGVLQVYFAMEQNNLQQIDQQMEEKFGFRMDPNKMYDLNRDAMEIREVGPIEAPAPVE